MEADLSLVAVVDVDVALDGVVELETGKTADHDFDGRRGDR